MPSSVFWNGILPTSSVHICTNRTPEPHGHRAVQEFPSGSKRRKWSASTRASRLGAGNPLCSQRHHSHEEICALYHAASFCMVTSLHDGNESVAKEFVAARENERGALILSTFAGGGARTTRCFAGESLTTVRSSPKPSIGALEMTEESRPCACSTCAMTYVSATSTAGPRICFRPHGDPH